MARIIGAVYPIPVEFVSRLFDEGRDVFVKYLPRSTTRLKRGSKILFYASGGNRELVGEGVIAQIEFLKTEDVISKFGDRLFLSKKELEEYTKSQPSRSLSKPLLVLTFKEIHKYPKAIKYRKPMTMAGRYVTISEYNRILKQ